MSANIVFSQSYLIQLNVLLSLLEKNLHRWKSASTLGERLLIESEVLNRLEALLAGDADIINIKPGAHPEITELSSQYQQHYDLLLADSAKLQAISTLYLEYYNASELLLQELIGKLRRIEQKRATLALWEGDTTRFLVTEKFYNLNRLDFNLIGLEQCNIDLSSGVVTLPVNHVKPIAINDIAIAANSNGQPGNSDIAVTTTNTNLDSLLSSNEFETFEYERLDNGPCYLNLRLSLSTEEIVNSITITNAVLETNSIVYLDDVIFTSSSNEEISIFDLLLRPKEPFVIKAVETDTQFTINFLPTVAKSILLKFRSSDKNQVFVASDEGVNVLRDRYAVALSQISLERREYKSSGGLASKAISLSKNLFACIPFIEFIPRLTELFQLSLEVSFNGGSSWNKVDVSQAGIGNTQLLESGDASLLWKLSINRIDDAFSNLTSFSDQDEDTVKISSILRTVSRLQSPAEVKLPSTTTGNIAVFQPQLLRRGESDSRIVIGYGSAARTAFKLPFEVEAPELIDQIKVLVNNLKYSLRKDTNTPGPEEYVISDDLQYLVFDSSLPAGARIEVFLDDEILSLEERSNGFYYYPMMPFDPDKDNIKIQYFPKQEASEIFILPRDKTAIKLRGNRIISSSFTLRSELGRSYTEVSSKEDVATTANSYYVDYVNGFMWLNQPLNDDFVTATYKHKTIRTLDKNDYEIVLRDNKPAGIRINKNAFAGIEFTETLKNQPQPRLSILTGEFKARLNNLSLSRTARTLTYDCLIKGSVSVSSNLVNSSLPPEEVEFIDGRTEFLGLVPILNEVTNTIEADSNGIVSFSLSAGALWYEELGVAFSDTSIFATEVASASDVLTGNIGDYHVDASGLVTLNVGIGNSLPAGIEINYFYSQPEFDPSNKYSIDYRNGILYTYSPINNTATITYKSACYKMSYDIVRYIDEFEYNSQTNSLSLRTENLLQVNNLVKVIWFDKTDQTLDAVKDYFSPLIYTVGFRFN